MDPVRQPNNLDHPTDQEVLVAGMRIVRDSLHAPKLSTFLEHETVPGLDVTTDDAMLDFVRNNRSTGYRLIGTARMGRADDPFAVVEMN